MTDMSMNDLLDATLDDIADLPEFANFHAGGHKAKASFSEKDINDKKAIELKLVLTETIELADPQQEPQVPGTEASLLFFLDNEFGLGNLKKCAMPFAQALGLSTIRDVIEQVKDVDCVAITGIRKDKNDPDKQYMNIKEIAVTG